MADGTADGGGHAAAIAARLAPGGTLLALDWDAGMADRLRATLGATDAAVDIRIRAANYADLPEMLKREKLGPLDGLLLDLGFSSDQLEHSGRGFSFMKDEPLMMVYDDAATPVSRLLGELTETELADVIYQYGGERRSRQIAKAIKTYLKKKAIDASGTLAAVVRDALPRGYERGRIDRATRTFQALRIYANKELQNLARALESLPDIMAPGGRAAIITFHSLEDKLVKEWFRKYAKEGRATLTVKKPLTPSREELLENPRSRSAKLRVLTFTTIT